MGGSLFQKYWACIINICVSYLFLGTTAWLPEEYPEYCSKDISARNIPQLTKSEEDLINKLVQVQVIIRHGSRTPFTKYSCWNGYDVQWDCNLTEVMYVSPSRQKASSKWLFRKIYDGSPNSLGGNCETGQLLEDGYVQESINGKILREAYIGPKSHHLLKSHLWELNNPQKFYFRSDDEQRTLISGQSLVHGMFEIDDQEIIDWHTGDYSLDSLYPNSGICPRLDNITSQAYTSKEYLTSSLQRRKQDFEAEVDGVFGKGYWSWNFMIDCLMTSVCNDHHIPDGDGAHKMSSALFNYLIDQAEFDFYFKFKYNKSIYSKLAMSTLAYNLRSRLEDAMQGGLDALDFVLYAGHDTTIMPLLAVLPSTVPWDGKWAPYGALLSVELYEAKSSDVKFLFRIVYNGKALILKSCPGALCNISVLLDVLAFGQKAIPEDCAAISEHPTFQDSIASASGRMFLVAFLSSIFSVLGTYIFMRKKGGTQWYTRIDVPDCNVNEL